MLKKLVLAAVLVATSAIAQESTDISGANFQSGNADAALASLGRKAAASGSRLVITAPKEWHAKIAAKVRAGGKADLVLRDGFYETVLVRVEDKSAATAAAEPDRARAEAQRSRAEVEKARAETEAARAQAEAAKAEAEKARAEAEAAKAAAEKASAEAAAAKARADAERAAAEQARVESERAAATAPGRPLVALPASSSAAPAAVDVRSRMEKDINGGRSAKGSLAVAKLQAGDSVYVDGEQLAVVRREAGKPVMYWLDGALDLGRSELKPTAPNRYQVLAKIRGEGVPRQESAGESRVDAQLPAADSPARTGFEKNFNNGHGIDDTLHPNDLRRGDVLYVDGSAVLVVRRGAIGLTRSWLVGTIDLQQAGIARDAANRYRVMRDTVR